MNNKYYAVVFKFKNATHSYFGLDTNDLKFVKNILDKLGFRYNVYSSVNKNFAKKYANNSYKDNQQLKQSQKQLAIEELEKVKEINFDHFVFYGLTPKQSLEKWIDYQIRLLRRK